MSACQQGQVTAMSDKSDEPFKNVYAPTEPLPT
jgi:hypothetical protein